MSINDLMKELYQDLPDEAAYQVDPERGLSGYKPQFVIDRLNELFPFDWSVNIVTDNEGKLIIKERDGYVGVYCQLDIYVRVSVPGKEEPERRLLYSCKQWGGNQIENDNWPDAMKGAVTNALCKCASVIGIGSKAYRGELNAYKPTAMNSSGDEEIDKVKKDIAKIAKKKDVTKADLQGLAKKALNKLEKVDLDKLSLDDLILVREELMGYKKEE